MGPPFLLYPRLPGGCRSERGYIGSGNLWVKMIALICHPTGTTRY